MRVIIDTKQKTVEVLDEVKIHELYRELQEMLGLDLEYYKIKQHIETVTVPYTFYNPYPWPTNVADPTMCIHACEVMQLN